MDILLALVPFAGSNHSYLMSQHKEVLSFKTLRLLLLLLLISCQNKHLEKNIFNIALWDTETCMLSSPNQQIMVESQIEMTNDFPMTQLEWGQLGTTCGDRDNIFYRNIHGQYSLDTIIKNLELDKLQATQIKIWPLKLYSRNGTTQFKFWQKALYWTRSQGIQLHIIPSGLILNNVQELNNLPLPNGITFAASPTFGAGISNKTLLWPNEVIKNSKKGSKNAWAIAGVNLTLANSLKGHFDPAILDAENVDLTIMFPKISQNFAGNSWATNAFAASAISVCQLSKMKNNINNFNTLEACFEDMQKTEIATSTSRKLYPLIKLK